MKNILTIAILSVLVALSGCDTNDRTNMQSNYPSDYDVNYGIRQVMQYDEVNIDGIDLATRLPFFDTLRLTIHYTGSKISAVTFSNGNIPFSPYTFEVPAGKTDAYLDTEALPNALRLTGTDHVIAYFRNGEFSIPFKLDCPALDYKYTFKSINQ